MTEFTGVGLHCSAENCNQQDFLPFTCDCCNGECVTFSIIIYSRFFPRLIDTFSRSCSYPAAVIPTTTAAAADGRFRSVDRLVRVLSRTEPLEENREEYLCVEHPYTLLLDSRRVAVKFL